MTYPIFENEAKILETTYYHTMTVKRPKDTTRKHLDEFKYEVVYEDVKCAVSFTQGSKGDLSDTVQVVQYDATLFARPGIRILAGDILICNILGEIYEFRAGEGYLYQSHIEVPLIRNEVA